MFTEKTVQELAQVLGEKLTQAELVVATAESCTGGGVAYAITEISGSSLWFDRSFVTYSNAAKIEMIDVAASIIKEFGAVSEQVAEQMAIGAVKNSDADIAVAISGIAGPEGGTIDKPVGTVCISWYNAHSHSKTASYLFVGDRSDVRTQAIRLALLGLIEII
ncbi:CinA family protein [Psychromonas antarctica]|uniref:CinA family protein n=1 Tax=Psychromonas antarctica TaxID=67573 RepID=UPI001EE83833|nr:CinA family protein [Psychromonas antarctica]MCG6200545.1 CinA family protein [Psychromonas antarctica]